MHGAVFGVAVSQARWQQEPFGLGIYKKVDLSSSSGASTVNSEMSGLQLGLSRGSGAMLGQQSASSWSKEPNMQIRYIL